MYNLKQLRRLRRLVGTTVFLGIAVSVAMNVLNAPPTLAAQIVSTIPPILVFGAIELIARIPGTGKWLTAARVTGAGVVALGAASISYSHQKAAVQGLGFDRWESYIWPAIIDGFMVVASISLVEVVRRIRQLGDEVSSVAEQVNAVGMELPVPTSPAAPVGPRPPVNGMVRHERPAGRGGPQVTGPSRPGLSGKPLMEAPPQV